MKREMNKKKLKDKILKQCVTPTPHVSFSYSNLTSEFCVTFSLKLQMKRAAEFINQGPATLLNNKS